MNELKHTVYFNEIHPFAVYINKTDSNVQNQLSKVERKYPHHHLILRTMNDDNIQDYIDADFIEFRRTYEQDIVIDDLIDYLTQNMRHETFNTFTLDEALIKKSYEVYKQTHKTNPVKDMPLNEWEALLTADLDYDHSIILKDKENITAFLLIYNANDNTKDIGYIYYQDAECKEKLYDLFYTRLTKLKNVDIKEISLEVDNTDRYAYEFFEAVLIHDETFMRTLILSKKVEDLNIKSIDLSDVKYLHVWSQDRDFCLANDWPLEQSIQDISKWWNHVIEIQSDSFIRHSIYYRDSMIGYFDVVHHNDNTIELGIAIGENKFRNMGLGSLIFSKITKYLSLQYPDRNIIGVTKYSNIASQRMMIKSGYVRLNELKASNEQELTFRYIK